MNQNSRVIVALDEMDLLQAAEMAGRVRLDAYGVKAGFELATVYGAHNVIKALQPLGLDVFLDVKLHDIPSTVAKAVRRLMREGVWMINMHISGGPEMMKAARLAVDEVWANRKKEAPHLTMKPLLIGVTVLTSLTYDELTKVILPVQYGKGAELGKPQPIVYSEAEQAEKLRAICVKMALEAKACGLDGVVTSPQEAPYIRAAVPDPTFDIVTPGIRSAEDAKDDQVRIASPAGAIEAGATWLVIGRPVTKAIDPVTALQIINQQVADALEKKEGVLA